MRVLVVGDIMIDRYVHVTTRRQAAEADIPVWDVISSSIVPGGAANVARNLRALDDDLKVDLAGICSKQHEILFSTWSTTWVSFGSTMEKVRYVHDGDYIFRCDNFKKFDPEDVTDFEDLFMEHVDVSQYDAVVVSDYDKGTITEMTAQKILKHPLTFVDSKRRDIRIFTGAKVLKVNELEYSAQVSSREYPNFTEFFENVVVTLGGKGASLLMCERTKSNEKKYVIHREDFPIRERRPVDVTGCGDTFSAALALATIKNGDLRKAIKFANECAGAVVGKFGTETP